MGTLQILQLLLVVTVMKICAAQNDETLTVYTVTSKSLTLQWTPTSGATFYRLKATPKNSPQGEVFVQFGQNTVIGSIISLTPDTQYTVQVEAMDNQMNVIASAQTDALTAPDIPSIDKTYSKTSESITVEFPEVPGATGYILRAESKTDTFFLETPVSSSPGTVQGLQPFTEYEISILSVNDGGRSQPSYPVDQTTVVVAPNLNTSSPNSTSIVAAWEPVENAVLYTFVIIEEASMARIDINTTDVVLVLDNLQPGHNYTIKAQALDNKGRLGDDLTCSQITRPASPTLVDVLINSQSRATAMVFWGAVPGAATYTVWTSNNQTCTSTNFSYCYLGPVQCSQNQTVIVLASNYAGDSEPSEPAKYLSYPCHPNNTRIVELHPLKCAVIWDTVEMADYYVAYVKRNDASGHEKICNTPEPICEFDCMCGLTFTGIVVPYNKVGGSPIIQLVNYTTTPCCPDSLNITLASSETVEIEWSEARGADLYQVTAVRTTALETNETVHCNDTETICALSDLECDTSYWIKVTPCSEISGCNEKCQPQAQVTAPCAPEVTSISQFNASTYRVHFNSTNRAGTEYTIMATAPSVPETYECKTTGGSCDLTELPCGTTFEVKGVATSTNGELSLLGYEMTLETGPCCPDSITVEQQSQAMTTVSWSPAAGARSFITSLTSSRGAAKCHTVDDHCLMGCITCSTNYTVSMEAISSTGHTSQCSYKGFSSSPCCPTHIKLNRRLTNILSVAWRPQSSPSFKHIVEVTGNGSPLSCEGLPGQRFCEIVEPTCSVDYTVHVVPVLPDGTKVNFCQKRKFQMLCPGIAMNAQG